MKISKVEFIGSATSLDACPKPVCAEVAFAGRSNVGKSSLINRMVHRKALAKVSSTPGKTRTINFFRVNDAFYLVDLPGYGYARRSKEERSQWPVFIENYLRRRRTLVCVVLLIDASIPPVRSDEEMNAWLHHYGVPVVRAFTKADKARQGDLARRRQSLDPSGAEPCVFVSARTGRGIDELWKVLYTKINASDVPSLPPEE